MPYLEITTFGGFRVSVDGQAPTALRTDKARALLVYLTAEAPRPQRREALASMFWPDRPESAARNNLRQTLYRIRTALDAQGPHTAYLLTTASEIQFNPGVDYALDVDQFSTSLKVWGAHHLGGRTLCGSCLEHLRGAVSLYDGDFMAGFSLPGCPQFEWWLLSKQELYHRQSLEILVMLGSYYESCRDYRQAGIYAQKEIELEPWRESAHRRRMRALALGGERAEAVQQYEKCHAILANELGIEPSKTTRDLYEVIRAGGNPGIPKVQSPEGEATPPRIWKPAPSADLFVGFESELAQLERHLAVALSGRPQVVFISGEAGSGKTTLLIEFIRRALRAHGDLLAAIGICNAHFGYGDPYLPFRQALHLLTGDMESARFRGALGEERISRLWSALPSVLEALLEDGPELVGSLLPLESLHRHAHILGDKSSTIIARLEAQAGTGAGARSDTWSKTDQVAIFDRITRMLLAIARQYPLILALDDLQWADRGTLSLLFHLARNLRDTRVLVIGTYRPEEITLDRAGERHPLQTLVNELLTQFGEIRVDLSQNAGWDFVNALLDSEPNDLDEPFRKSLFQITEGHPLFTVEQLRSMQESGGLVQDGAGRWTTGEILDWESIPARVDAVIAERLARLSTECRELLEAASVQGESFSAETLAVMLGESEGQIVERLSVELGRQHRLIYAESLQRFGETTSSRYCFRHALYQRQLYQNLDIVHRARLHQATAEVIERSSSQAAGGKSRIKYDAARLAFHFDKAGLVEKAIQYHQIAGEQAYRLAANEDAILHFNRALELLKNIPDSSDRIRGELILLISLSSALNAARGYAEPELRPLFERVGELATKGGGTEIVAQALYLRGSYHYARAEYQQTLDTGTQLMELFNHDSIPWISDMANFLLGVARLNMGDLMLAREHLEIVHQAESYSDRVSYSQSPSERLRLVYTVFLTWVYWLLGDPDKALSVSQQLLVRVRKSGVTYFIAFTLGMSTCLVRAFRGDFEELQERAQELLEISRGKVFLYQAWSKILLGVVQVDKGEIESGLANIRNGLQEYRATGHISVLTIILAMQAEAYGKAGRYDEGLESLVEAFHLADETGERLYEAELHRLRGELLLANGGTEQEIEACFQQALQITRNQGARSLELRAATSLAKLWSSQDRITEAHKLLEGVFNGLSEGFDTNDLKAIKALLELLSANE